MKRFIIVACLLCSCGVSLERPFVITGKNPEVLTGMAGYLYQDAKGTKMIFRDSTNKYSIGDTIK